MGRGLCATGRTRRVDTESVSLSRPSYSRCNGGSLSEGSKGGDLSHHGHSVHAYQYSVPTVRSAAEHADACCSGEAFGNHPGSLSLLAHGKCRLRTHQRDHNSTRQRQGPYVGYRSDDEVGPAPRSTGANRRTRDMLWASCFPQSLKTPLIAELQSSLPHAMTPVRLSRPSLRVMGRHS